MKTKPEDIPAAIFDWLATNNFASLNKEQREQVLLYFSEEEYNELHSAAVSIHNASAASVVLGRKKELMERFDAVRETPVRPLFSVIWKAAALFIFFGSGWLLHGFLSPVIKMKGPVSANDTIYITREVASAPGVIYDTVYLEKAGVKENVSVPVLISHGSANDRLSIDLSRADTPDLLLNEIDSVANRQKNNSLKDDSLLRKFIFVTI